MGYKPPRQR